MNRLHIFFRSPINTKRKALSLYVTAGFPTLETTVPLVLEMERAGTDIIEIGIPFSDPVADGPVIQESSEMALRNGVTLQKTFEMVEQIRNTSNIPLVLMGYANSIFSFGIEKFITRCHQIGVDGVIIPDFPIEESVQYRTFASRMNVSTIYLATPTTPNERLLQLDEVSDGFLYCVSVTGVTGERKQLSIQAKKFLQRARGCVKKNPLLVGFGISTPGDAEEIANYSDGIIIGSAFIKVLQYATRENIFKDATKFVSSFRKVLQ